MGVLGLWQLLAPVGQPVTLESLENKIFAVDISIWLNQALKGYRDSEGGSVPNAHLLSLFSRLCKLLFYKIRPIIVFDGGFPELKKQTIINRQKRRAAVKQSNRDIGLKILTNYLASQQLGQVTNKPVGKTVFTNKEKARDEIFKLPPLPENSGFGSEDLEDNEIPEWKFTGFSKEDLKYLNQIEIDSEDFNSLPPEVKLEILSTLKETRKHRTWDQYEELPEESHEFSKYQMQCLLKRRKLQSKLEQVQKDIRELKSADFVSQYTNDHVIGETNKIMSDDCSYYVLLKKIIDNSESKSNEKSSNEMTSDSSTSMIDSKNAFIKDIENIDVDDYSSVFFQDVKNETRERIPKVAVKPENVSIDIDLADEEYEIDNPTTSNIATIIQSSNSNNEKSNANDAGSYVRAEHYQQKLLMSDSILSQSNTSKDNVRSLNKVPDEEMLYKGDIKVAPSTSSSYKSSESEIEILSRKDQNACKLENSTVNETVVVSSSEDELVLCEEAETEDLNCTSSSLNDINNYDLSSEVFPSSDLINSSLENAKVSKNSTVNLNEVFVNNSNQNSSQKVNSAITFPGSENNSSIDLQTEKKILTSPLVFDLPLSDEKEVMSDEVISANLELKKNLDSATALLEAERAKQDRQSSTVQEHMIEDCKELLRLFGIPYVVSPLEAEAQCAFYDSADLTHGTITDDSDVWLFGGKRVYKNFFTQQKFVEFFKDKEVFSHFGLSRKKLINFALLTGSDYTEGIENVGPVTAMEIISEFTGEDLDALHKFKQWWTESNRNARPPENKVRAKLLKLVLPENFPDSNVFEAYLNPEVDSSTEKFTWGRPDLDALRDYMRERFGWNKGKVDDALLPVIKKLNERNTQTHLDSFFTVSLKKQADLFPSKRIMSALKKISNKHKDQEETEAKTSKRKSRTFVKKGVPAKVAKKSIKQGRMSKNKSKPQGPVLSEESSDDA